MNVSKRFTKNSAQEETVEKCTRKRNVFSSGLEEEKEAQNTVRGVSSEGLCDDSPSQHGVQQYAQAPYVTGRIVPLPLQHLPHRRLLWEKGRGSGRAGVKLCGI